MRLRDPGVEIHFRGRRLPGFVTGKFFAYRKRPHARSITGFADHLCRYGNDAKTFGGRRLLRIFQRPDALGDLFTRRRMCCCAAASIWRG
ncbi:hypothetical protein KCP77_19085 [Salmonella enterica subsp. enterica]|nr:hypothetical protein KCP77_19085 [Salmonella enterica subsp. enterica]